MKIDDMPAGYKMDLLVTEKVMEWAVIPHLGCALIDDRERPQIGGFAQKRFHPSTDIASAWEVMEKLKLLVEEITLRWLPGDDEYPSGWFCNGIRPVDTAPLAICRAALKAVGITEV